MTGLKLPCVPRL